MTAAGVRSARRLPLTEGDDPGLMARIVRLQILAAEQLEDVAARHGIAFNDYLVLGVIRRASAGRCAPSFICEVLHRTSGGMTLTLDRLERSGWVLRDRDQHDRRRVVLRLTPAGRALAKAVNTALHTWEASLGRPLSAQRSRAMMSGLDQLLDLLEDQ